MNSSDLFRQFLDAGMQFTQLTQRRAEAIVKDLVKAGELQAEQAQATVAEFVDRSRENTEKFFEQVRTEIRQQLKVLGVATKDDLAKVESKMEVTRPAAAKKAPAKRTAAKKAPAKKAAGRKAAAKKTAAKKAPAKKAPAKKTAAQNAPSPDTA